MYIIDSEKINTNYGLCKKCGGSCCKRNACDCSPEDFGNDIEKMREALKTGNYSIDFSRCYANSFLIEPRGVTLLTEKIINSGEEFLYIRPKNQGRPTVDIIHGEDIEGPCIFWNKETGCSLKYEERPMGGRTLIPSPDPNKCIPQYSKDLMRKDWKPFTKELADLAKEFFDPSWILYRQFRFSIK